LTRHTSFATRSPPPHATITYRTRNKPHNFTYSLFKASLFDIALQAVVQGVLTAIVALLLYGRMVSLLGATSGAAFVALTPVITGLMGIPVLGEWPPATDWVAISVISIGVYVVSGGPLPHRVTTAPSIS
jgi:drug/metabolite transporter (DMT)-like permease